jgi:hypothetical protein
MPMSGAERHRRYRERHRGDLVRTTLDLRLDARDRLDRLGVHYGWSLTVLVEELAASVGARGRGETDGQGARSISRSGVQVSPNIVCARSTGKATKGWATINAIQFLESGPRINILILPGSARRCVTLWQRGLSISQRKDSLTVRGRAPSRSATSSPHCGAARSTQQALGCQPRPGFPDGRRRLSPERLTLTSGRFAMIDNGLGFALVPWDATGISATMSPASPRGAAGSSGVSGTGAGWRSDGLFQNGAASS